MQFKTLLWVGARERRSTKIFEWTDCVEFLRKTALGAPARHDEYRPSTASQEREDIVLIIIILHVYCFFTRLNFQVAVADRSLAYPFAYQHILRTCHLC
jgi:hypothetical protein